MVRFSDIIKMGDKTVRREKVPSETRAAEEKLSLRLGTKVEIRSQRRGGKIVISCRDQKELMRVFDRLMEDN